MRDSPSLAALVLVAALVAVAVVAFSAGREGRLAQAPRDRPPTLWLTR
jgi:hypothetical protein